MRRRDAYENGAIAKNDGNDLTLRIDYNGGSNRGASGVVTIASEFLAAGQNVIFDWRSGALGPIKQKGLRGSRPPKPLLCLQQS